MIQEFNFLRVSPSPSRTHSSPPPPLFPNAHTSCACRLQERGAGKDEEEVEEPDPSTLTKHPASFTDYASSFVCKCKTHPFSTIPLIPCSHPLLSLTPPPRTTHSLPSHSFPPLSLIPSRLTTVTT